MARLGLRLPRLKLAPRIGLAIVLAVGAAFILNQTLRALIPPPPFLIVQRDWLVGAVVDAARVAATADQDDRRAALLRQPSSRHLDFAITHAAAPPAEEADSRLEARLRHAIANGLAVPVDRVRVAAEIYDQRYAERTVQTAVVIIPELPAMLTSEMLASNDSTVLGELAISVQLRGGDWLRITQSNLKAPAVHYTRLGVGIVGYLIILALFSIWIARSIVVPLTRLAEAAEQLGRSREPTLIGEMRLPETAAIADSFNTMQLRLKRFIDERMGMLAAISHDLRTPLTRLRLMAEYLDNAEQRDQLLQNVNEMETMIGDTLAFMNEEARREQVEVVDLAALLISLTDEHGDMGQRVVYRGPEHADLPCRPLSLKRAFSNLIANGCKYGGAVEVRLDVADAAFTVDVRDEGSGIAPHQEERAFRPFERLEMSRNRETGGSGLGLSISRDIVNGHGGEIGFVRPDTGFIVRVTLPRPPAA